jgi:hypothetical protein
MNWTSRSDLGQEDVSPSEGEGHRELDAFAYHSVF